MVLLKKLFPKQKKTPTPPQEVFLHQIFSQRHLEFQQDKMRSQLREKVKHEGLVQERNRCRLPVYPILQRFFNEEELSQFWNWPWPQQRRWAKQMLRAKRLSFQEARTLFYCCERLFSMQGFEEELAEAVLPEQYHLVLEKLQEAREISSALVACFADLSTSSFNLLYTLLAHALTHSGEILSFCPTEKIDRATFVGLLRAQSPALLLEEAFLSKLTQQAIPLLRRHMIHTIDLWVYRIGKGEAHIPQIYLEVGQQEVVSCFESLSELEKMLDPNQLKSYIIALSKG